MIKDKKGRSIIKEGGFRFNPYIILYAIYKYSYKYILFEIDIDKIENDLFSPPKVLIVDSKYIKNCLLDLQHLDIFEIDINNNNSFFIKLKEIKSPYEVIKILFAKEKL